MREVKIDVKINARDCHGWNLKKYIMTQTYTDIHQKESLRLVLSTRESKRRCSKMFDRCWGP